MFATSKSKQFNSGALDLDKRKKEVKILASELINSVGELANAIPVNESMNLRSRLETCAGTIEPLMSKTFDFDSRIERLRYWIKAHSTMQEFRDYLDLIEKLRYANTSGMREKLLHLNSMLDEDYKVLIKE